MSDISEERLSLGEGAESTSQGGGNGLADGGEAMAIGKLSKTAKKRAKMRARRQAAAIAEAERHAVHLATVTRTKKSASERLQARKRRINKQNSVTDNGDDGDGADGADAEGANQGATTVVPAATAITPAPLGSPEDRKSKRLIKLKKASVQKGLMSANAQAEQAIAQATTTVQNAEARVNAMQTSDKDVEIARLHAETEQRKYETARMQLEVLKMQMIMQQGKSGSDDGRDEQPVPSDKKKGKAPMSKKPIAEPVSAPAVPAAAVAAVAAADQAGPSSATAAHVNPAGHSYMAAALVGQTKAQLQAELAQAKADLEKAQEALEESQVQAAELQSRVDMFEGKTFLQALNKPAVFTGAKVIGKPSLSVRDWMLAVTDYTTSIGMHDEKKKVAIAESYLGGDAKRDWHTKRRVLQEEGTTITFEVFSKSVIDSWDPACSDVKARAQLETIKFKGNITVYVSMFDRICSFIPNMTADEKVHKFLYQIRKTNPTVADKLQTDPSTKKTWNDYHQLRQYALHAAATDAMTVAGSQTGVSNSSAKRKRHAGVFADVQHTMDQLNKRRKSGENGNWPRNGSSGGAGPSRGGNGGGGNGGGNGGGSGWQQRHGVRQLTEFTNAAGEKFVRSSADMNKLQNRQPRLCACCLQPSSLRHYAATCTNKFRPVPNDW